MEAGGQHAGAMTTVTALVGLVTILAWAGLVSMAAMGEMSMATSPWALSNLAAMFIMWVLMMAAMMLPATLPMLRMARRLLSDKGHDDDGGLKTLLFGFGYVTVWTGFSLAATLTQSALQHATLLSPALQGTSALFSGLLFVVAGAFQFTRLKTTCLEFCRSPLGFFLGGWRDGRLGAFRMGLAHGAFCLGCCWALMLLLFTFGVMNLYWVVVLTVLVMMEKLTPFGLLWSRAVGAIFIVGGLAATVSSLI